MSLYWDGWYAVVLDEWNAPPGFRACAESAYPERAEAERLDSFDSVQLLDDSEYRLVEVPSDSRTLTCLADGQAFHGEVFLLEATAEPPA